MLDTVRSFGSRWERAGCCRWRANSSITCRRWTGGNMCWRLTAKNLAVLAIVGGLGFTAVILRHLTTGPVGTKD